MTETDRLADYDILFQKLDEGITLLQNDPTMDYADSVRLSAEIEELRAITQQVNEQSAGFQLVTIA